MHKRLFKCRDSLSRDMQLGNALKQLTKASKDLLCIQYISQGFQAISVRTWNGLIEIGTAQLVTCTRCCNVCLIFVYNKPTTARSTLDFESYIHYSNRTWKLEGTLLVSSHRCLFTSAGEGGGTYLGWGGYLP